MQGMPHPPGLLSDFDNCLPRNWSTVRVFQVQVTVFIILVSSMLAMSLLLSCQAICLAGQIVTVSLESLCSPEPYIRVVLWIQWGWYVFGRGQEIGSRTRPGFRNVQDKLVDHCSVGSQIMCYLCRDIT